jgi:hypothetical protein
MTRPSHIFIVGTGRSGTSLMRRILNSSEDVAICGEAYFLGYWRMRGFRHRLAKVGDISTDVGAKKVVDYIYDRIDRGFWRWVQQNVDREQFSHRLLESDRTDRALFDLVMDFYAEGKPIRGEKTPANIYSVPTLLEWFPNAKIIHMLRDSRAVYVSSTKKAMMDKPQWHSPRIRLLRRSELMLSLYASLTVPIHWRRIVQLHHRYQQAYPRSYYLVKFEDLVTDPRACITKLCNFLKIDFTETMLRQRVYHSSLLPAGTRIEGFDTVAIDRWRDHLHPLLDRWFVTCCRKQLLEFGYRP